MTVLLWYSITLHVVLTNIVSYTFSEASAHKDCIFGLEEVTALQYTSPLAKR